MTRSNPPACALSVTIAARFKAEREYQELSQRELARRVKVSQAMLALIERGARNLTLPMIERLAGALGVSVSEFVPVSLLSGTEREG